MIVTNLSENATIYTSNTYLVTGTWKTIADINTLIDPGRDQIIFENIKNVSTGVGKSPVERVLITHNHYDHVELLSLVKELYNPEVYAFSSSLKGVDKYVNDGDFIEVADRVFEVIHAPGHSSDSICFYCEEEKALFSGDVPVIIQNRDSTYESGFVKAMEKIRKKDVQVIYFGHGKAMVTNCNAAIQTSLNNIRQSMKNIKEH